MPGVGPVLAERLIAARPFVSLADLARVLEADAPWIVQTVNFDRLLPLAAPHDFPPLAVEDGLVFRRRYEPGPDGAVALTVTASPSRSS